jgi:hypothetical protein
MSKEPLSPNAIKYSWRQLIQRTGVLEFTEDQLNCSIHGIPLLYEHPTKISCQGKKIIVKPTQNADWYSLLAKPTSSIEWITPEQAFPVTYPFPYRGLIPVIFRGDQDQKAIVEECVDGTLIFNVDILATVFFMLSRWEEMIFPSNTDIHGRFPASASVAYKQGFLGIPIVDVYALIFREWLQVLLPDWNPSPLKLKVNITHDIDWVSRFSDIGHFILSTGGKLVKQKKAAILLKQMKHLQTQVTTPAKDEFYTSIRDLAELSEKHGIHDRFYFMAARPSKYQQGYNPMSPLVKSCMLELRERGHEIGIHPGYETFKKPEKLLEEKKRLEEALGTNISGGRQHFLRFNVSSTWRHWEQAGLLYDSTMGYADHEGFRCGTCHPYHPFDLERDCEMKIEEIPLIVMDVTLKLYRKLSLDQARSKILELADKCKTAGGTFTLLWHNTSLMDDWLEWRTMYSNILSELSALIES